MLHVERCTTHFLSGDKQISKAIEVVHDGAQNATERPSFAEIIQVLRRLLADEARRVANESPGDAVAARTQQASTSGSSADTARPEQVEDYHADVSCRSAFPMLPCLLTSLWVVEF